MKKDFDVLVLKYDKDFGGHFADKPIYKDGVEVCICNKHKIVKVCDVFDNKPDKLINTDIFFNKLDDRNIYVSLELFTKEDYDVPDVSSCGEWGWQVALIDKDTHYELEYQDGFITGDARGGSDFQELTSDWQW